MNEYKTRYANARSYFETALPGFNSMIMVEDKTNPNLVHDVQVFENMDAFM